ncbi:hypothetical protein TI03_05050, partial [Achromatium sp. WMS1]
FLNEASETDIKALKVGITGKTINILITERNRQPFTSRKDCIMRMKEKKFTGRSYDKLAAASKSAKQHLSPVPNANSTTTPFNNGIDKLNNMNEKELAINLSRLKINKSVVQAILDNRAFNSFNEMSNIKGLGSKTIDKLRNAFASL